MTGSILFRCDATRHTGLGHLNRCLGLAEAFDDLGVTSIFAGCFESPWADEILAAGCAAIAWHQPTGSVGDAAALAHHARALGVDHIVADDYRIDQPWLETLNARGWRPILFDDFGRLPDYGTCRGIINFGAGVRQPEYHHVEPARVLYGPAYFPARRHLTEVRASRACRSTSVDVERILVTLGGFDRLANTWSVLRALSRLAPTARVRAVVSRARMHSGEAKPFLPHLIESPPSLASHFTWADACISGGGLTKYEGAFVGLPVAMVAQTDDEQIEAAVFASEGLAYDLQDTPQANLDARLGEFLNGADLRRSLTLSGLRRFPAGSAANLARAVLAWARPPALAASTYD